MMTTQSQLSNIFSKNPWRLCQICLRPPQELLKIELLYVFRHLHRRGPSRSQDSNYRPSRRTSIVCEHDSPSNCFPIRTYQSRGTTATTLKDPHTRAKKLCSMFHGTYYNEYCMIFANARTLDKPKHTCHTDAIISTKHIPCLGIRLDRARNDDMTHVDIIVYKNRRSGFRAYLGAPRAWL